MPNSAAKIIFAGSPDFAAHSLAALLAADYPISAVYTQPDRPAGRGRKLRPSAVKELALQHNLDVIQVESLKPEAAQAQLRELAPDLMIVVAYGLLLPATVLQIPRLGCINVHASLLPRWRGAAPIQRAIIAGDKETGITIMQMEQGLDTGPMLYKATTPISAQETAAELHDRLAELGAQALLHSLPDILQQRLQAEQQDDALATYASKLSKEEASIDWQQDAELIARKIHAFNPFPVAHTGFNQQALRVWQAQAEHNQSSAAPGTLIGHDKQSFSVSCGKGSLTVTQVQMPGKKAVSAGEFYKAYVEKLSGPVIFG